MHNFETTSIFKIPFYGNFVMTFACLIFARNYNSSRRVFLKVLTLPVASKPAKEQTKTSTKKIKIEDVKA